MSQPPSSENPMDSIWERDSMSRGSASARENNKSHEGELLGPKCGPQAAAAPPSRSPSACRTWPSQALRPSGRFQARDGQAFQLLCRLLVCQDHAILPLHHKCHYIKAARHHLHECCVHINLIFMDTEMGISSDFHRS